MAYENPDPAGTVDAAQRDYTIPAATAPGTAAPAPAPVQFFAALNAYHQTAALKSAVELGLFTAIAGGASRPAEIAAKCDASERGIRILCDFLVVHGLLTKTDGAYGLTEESAMFLDRRSPAYLGGVLDFLLHPALAGNFQNLTAIVRHGGTLMPDDGALAPEHPMWVQFARSMAPMMMMSAKAIAHIANGEAQRPLKVLDIAAGHGLFGISVAQANPQARIVALDWPNVLEVAKENAASMGVSDRYDTIAGSAFNVDFGGGYDVVLLTNLMHHFDIPTNETLLRKCYNALTESGRLITLEFVPNEDRVSPPMPATFSIMMLTTTPNGDAYTPSQFTEMYSRAGFSRCEIIPLLPSPGSAVVGYKGR